MQTHKDNQCYLFTDCDIVGKVNGVCFTYSKEGRPSGEAFIELKTAEDFKNSLSKDRKYMGHRYIEGKLIPILIICSFNCLSVWYYYKFVFILTIYRKVCVSLSTDYCANTHFSAILCS